MMGQSGAQPVIDYTILTEGVLVEGKLWNGQKTESSVRCPQCGRIGVSSNGELQDRIIIHTGQVSGEVLSGIDYCRSGR